MKSKSILLMAALVLTLAANDNVLAQTGRRPTPCDLRTDLRKLWEDHITWTRNVIFCILDTLPGTNDAVARLLRNQVDIGDAIKPYYGVAAGNALTALLHTHITEAAAILTDLVTHNTTQLNTDIAAWYANGDSIAHFLAAANPYWPLAEAQTMMNNHLRLTTNEALARFNHDYAADVIAYDSVHIEILGMSDFISSGIVLQFRGMFSGPAFRASQEVELTDGAIMLYQNSPNPFSEHTTISYFIPESVSDAQIVFSDNNGNVIKTVSIIQKGAGSLDVYAPNLSNGIYTYSIITDGKLTDTKRMIH